MRKANGGDERRLPWEPRDVTPVGLIRQGCDEAGNSKSLCYGSPCLSRNKGRGSSFTQVNFEQVAYLNKREKGSPVQTRRGPATVR